MLVHLSVVLRLDLVPYRNLTLIGRAPPALHLKIIHHCVHLCIYSSLIMRLRSSPGRVKVSTLPGKPEVSGSIPESGLRFFFIFIVFTLCLPLCLDC